MHFANSLFLPAFLTVGSALLAPGISAAAPGPPAPADRVQAANLQSSPASLGLQFGSSCALTKVGGVKCWGSGYYGNLGNNNWVNQASAVQVQGFASGAIAVVGGWQHGCALNTTGGVQCWGDDESGQLGDGHSGYDVSRWTPVPVIGLSSGVTALSAGSGHSCALTKDGRVRCWGANGDGQIGDGTSSKRNRPVLVSGLTGAAAISAGAYHTCALTTTGGVKCWGENNHGQLGDGTMTNRQTPVLVKGLSSGIVAIAAGGDSTCALTKDGRVKCWGLNDEGQLGIGTMQQQRNAPVLVGAITGGIKAIAVGYNLGCALRTDGGVMCWGYNNHGQLGDGTTTTRRTPVAVKGITGVISIGVGGSQTCALISSGVAKCWGYNLSGEVGNGTWADSHLPVLVRNF